MAHTFLTYNIKIEVHTQENVHTQLQYKIRYNEIMVKPLLRGHLTLPKWSGHLISLAIYTDSRIKAKI